MVLFTEVGRQFFKSSIANSDKREQQSAGKASPKKADQ
jgi:hypothetical protein